MAPFEACGVIEPQDALPRGYNSANALESRGEVILGTDKCTTTKFSERPAKLTDEQVAQICRLDLQQVPEVLIARGLKLNRRTVSRVLARMRAAASSSKGRADLLDAASAYL